MPELFGALGFFLAAIGIGLSLFLVLERHRRSQWTGLAEELSLQFGSDAFFAHRVFGSYRGRPILVDTWFTRGGSFRSIVCTRVRLPVHDLQGLRIKVHRRPFVARLVKKLYPAQHTATDDALSQQYKIELTPPRFATALLGPNTPFGRLLRRREAHTLRVAEDELYFVKLGLHHSQENMLAIVNILLSGAEHCEQLVENELPPRFSRRKGLPPAAQYFAMAQERDKKRLLGVYPSTLSTLFVVMLISLFCLLPISCLILIILPLLVPF